jgi:hypothetical protein
MKPLGHAAPAALTEILRVAPLSDGKVSFAWTTAVGPAVGRATAVKLERGVLVVETASAQWSREIGRSSSLILKRLQQYLGGAVQRIEIRRA